MKKQKVLINFSRYSDAQLVEFNNAIQSAIPACGFFPTPAPALTVVATACTDLETAMAAAAVGGTAQTDFKNEKRAELIDLFQQLAAYIQLVSAGDPGKMKASAFGVSKIPSPVGPLPKPQKFAVEPGKKGQLKLSLQKIKGARIYQYEYKRIDATEWIVFCSSRTKITVQSLESGKEYQGRVLPIGASDEKVYSDIIACFVN